jgi:tetratricopeptide (TPR) repeat protein
VEVLRPSSSEVQVHAHAAVESLLVARSRAGLEIEDLIGILQAEPHNSSVAMELARRLIRSGRHEEALCVLRAVVKMDNRFETLFALAELEYQMEREAEAFLHLQQALMVAPSSAPEFFEIFKYLGNIFVRRGDLDSAEDAYFKAHRLNPDSDILHVNLGTLAIQRNQWDTAAENFRVALSLNAANDKAWVGLAISHRMKGDQELAWANLEAAIQNNPLNEVALQLAVDWGLREGRETRVLEHLRAFLIDGGWNEKLSLAFAWLSLKRGDRRLAILELERLLAVNPGFDGALRLAREMGEER